MENINNIVLVERVTEENEDDFSPKICFCCLKTDGYLINIIACSHSEFLNKYINMCNSKLFVCHICHYMLKKIELFKKQVQDNYFKLQKHADTLAQEDPTYIEPKSRKLINDLTITNIKSELLIDTSKSDKNDTKSNSDTNTVTLDSVDECKEMVVCEVKREFSDDLDGNSGYESEEQTPPRSIKQETDSQKTQNKYKKKSKKDDFSRKYGLEILNEYKDQIYVYHLTDEELMTEREVDRKRDLFVKKEFRCNDCIRGFSLKSVHDKHIEMFHTKTATSLTCTICNCEFKNRDSLTNHIRRHWKRYQCAVCGLRSTYMPTLISHFKKIHSTMEHRAIDEEYTCKLCNFKTDSHRRYRYHKEKHKPQKDCKICFKTFCTKWAYEYHYRTIHEKTNIISFPCTECSRTFGSRSGLQNHVQSKHKTNAHHYCELCQKQFSSRMVLVSHLKLSRNHGGVDDAKFICDYCGLKFVEKRRLIAHIGWTHMKIYFNQCNICQKPFKTISSMQHHIRMVHEKREKPKNKICDYCGRRFTSIAILRCHIRTHTGERPLVCSYCGATFAHTGALYTHRRLVHKVLGKGTQSNGL